MKIVGYYSKAEKPLLEAFLNGAAKYSHKFETHKVESFSKCLDCDCVVIRGWGNSYNIIPQKVIRAYQFRGIPVVVLCNSMLRQTQNKVYEVCLNGLSGYADNLFERDLPNDRWKILSKMSGYGLQPWKKTKHGKHILIAHQWMAGNPPFHGTRGFSVDRVEFYRNAVKEAVRYHDKVYVALHPYTYRRSYAKLSKIELQTELDFFTKVGAIVLKPTKKSQSQTYNYLDTAKCFVTYSSSGVNESIIKGMPTIAWGHTTADPMCSRTLKPLRDMSKLKREDRQWWVNWLAYQMWTAEEFAEGKPWEYIIERRKNKLWK